MPSSDDHENPNWIATRVANLVRRVTPACREVARLTSEERDHPLPLGARVRLGLHRRFCVWCARYTKQLGLLHEASQRLDEADGPRLKRDARERLKRVLRE